jgi:hypothetical protein
MKYVRTSDPRLVMKKLLPKAPRDLIQFLIFHFLISNSECVRPPWACLESGAHGAQPGGHVLRPDPTESLRSHDRYCNVLWREWSWISR